ncbi:related to epoxide hydrolase [Lecanosticta acicola]|uniref:Related to epoxide hydrolase n=1 Tax=Lecanosticta acicola TaxID=111012 RepID=A0AAI8Z739_9PEZI|nr:related to epoxide hydrolase [Lecanosticta acicola]
MASIDEKTLDWTHEDPPMSTPLEDVTQYWLTDCISTSLSPSRHLLTPGNIDANGNPAWHIHKPLGLNWILKEAAPVPEVWTETAGNLKSFRQHDEGGRSTAMQRPEALL